MEQQKTDNRFFGWMRATDIQRHDGWIGGVAAGIASKLGIDPLIVRGILVVVGILGAPVLLVYAAAWLLLPDSTDRIHLEEVTRGHFAPAVAGIGAMLILSLFPLSTLLPFDNYYWQNPLLLIGGGFWSVVVIGLAIAFVAWVAHRVRHHSPEATPVTVVATVVPDVAPASATPTEVISEPVATEPEATEEFAAWREQQEATKAATEEFRASAELMPAEAAAQRAAEHRALWAAQAEAQAEQRERRRRANPRLSAALVFVALGCALVASAIGALVASVDSTFTGSIGFAGVASAALVIGVAIVIAGALRRRSGFLSFVAAILVFFAVPLAFLPGDRQLIVEGSGMGPGKYVELFGSSYVYVIPGMTGTIDIWQTTGSVQIDFAEGSGAHIDAEIANGAFYGDTFIVDGIPGGQDESQPISSEEGIDVYSKDYGNPNQDLTIRLWQGSGSTWVNVYELIDHPDAEPSPTPSPTESPE